MEYQKNYIKYMIVELLMLIVYLYVYQISDLVFWILLILVDSAMLNRSNLKELLQDVEQMQNIVKDKRIMILSIGYLLALGVIAFKNFTLACILLGNEVLMAIVSLANVNNHDKN